MRFPSARAHLYEFLLDYSLDHPRGATPETMLEIMGLGADGNAGKLRPYIDPLRKAGLVIYPTATGRAIPGPYAGAP